MKAPSFAYAKPSSLAEAFELLERPGAKILAGGQSLIPSLNMRLSRARSCWSTSPACRTCSDIELSGRRLAHRRARHACRRSRAREEVAKHVPLLAEAVKHIAHPAIRNRGTSAAASRSPIPPPNIRRARSRSNATIVAGAPQWRAARAGASTSSKACSRPTSGPARSSSPPSSRRSERSVFLELARRHGDYAIVGLAGVASASGKRIVFFGAGGDAGPRRAGLGRSRSKRQAALKRTCSRPPTSTTRPATKLHLAKVSCSSAHGPRSRNHTDGQRHAGDAARRAAPAPGRFPARRAGPHRLAHRLRARRVRRVHGARRTARSCAAA